ncbi:MAG: 30S ribosomal protein S20 [bacterium]|nr:30S ribosomal protein S20 [bacterium]MDZ4285612.1 30S ribosomal protein S20 [Candidatus Sungbacteria bacterium]
MPITKTAIKALRQSQRRHKRNVAKSNAYKKPLKEIKKLASAGKQADAQKLLSSLYKALDKAAKTNVIKKNKASRIKSRITKKLSIKK